MKLIPFAHVRSRVLPGVPLGWNVRNGAGDLLLAKGQVITDMDMLEGLMERGAFVDADELQADVREDAAMTESLTSNWAALEARLGALLRSPAEKQFLQRVRETLVHVAATAHRGSDELIYLILRHDHSRLSDYGIAHALHTAALCGLLTRRLGWSNNKSTSLMGAALTMNISILELQGRLASRAGRPTAEEQRLIDAHPALSARILRASGLADEDWLQTVEQHHEVPGGTGYPAKVNQPTEMSQLLRFVDIFTAKHSPRVGRTPLPAHQAARDLFLQGKGNPMVSLLIKELGIYPPGCHVRLASGELGIVIRVGASAKTPIVAAVTGKAGEPYDTPVRRDTSEPEHAVVESVPEGALKVRVSADDLYQRLALVD